MPVFLVLINQHGRRLPERVGVATSHDTVEEAVAWTLAQLPGYVRDLDVEQLSDRDDCWWADDLGRRAA